MLRSFAALRRGLYVRRGLSFLEFVGCFSAMMGGVVVGSLYLGIDLPTTFKAVVQQAQGQTVLPATSDQRPPALANPAPSSATTPKNAPADPPPAPAPKAGLQEAETAVETSSAESSRERPSVATLADVIALTDEQRHQLTVEYWRALNECMSQEVANRSSPVTTSGEWELYPYLSGRYDGHKQAADAIAQLNRRGVDAHVTAYGEKTLAWHREGAALYARAKDLLTDAPTAQLSGPFAQSWQSAATQHQMEERLLAEKRAAVQAYLDHQAGEPPAEAATP